MVQIETKTENQTDLPIMTWQRLVMTAFGVLIAFTLLFISIWRSIDAYVEGALVPVGHGAEVFDPQYVALASNPLQDTLPNSRFLPHHPLYLGEMIYQRLVLWTTHDPEARATLLLTYAAQRYGVAMQLLERRRGEEAIEAATKGYMYTLEAADLIRSPQLAATPYWSELHEEMPVFTDAIQTMRAAVSDAIKSKFDIMLEEMKRLQNETASHLPSTPAEPTDNSIQSGEGYM